MKKSLFMGLCLALLPLCKQTLYGMEKKRIDYTKLSIHNIITATLPSTAKKIEIITTCLACQHGILKNNRVLAFALPHSPDPELIQFLLNQGLDVNEKSATGNHPLEYAVANENDDIVNILLNHPALEINLKDAKLLGLLSMTTTNICSSFLKKYYNQIDHQLFLQCALECYFNKPNSRICANIYTWARTCYHIAKPKNLQEQIYFMILLQKNFYGACSKIRVPNNTTFITNLQEIQKQFREFATPLLHNLFTQLHAQKDYNHTSTHDLFLEMCQLQHIIGRSHPDFDIFKGSHHSHTTCAFFQNYFETTQTKPTLKELDALATLAKHWKNNKTYKTLLTSYINHIQKYMLADKNGQSINMALDKIYSTALQSDNIQYADLLYTYFYHCPEKYTRYYNTQLKQKKLTQPEVALAFNIISRQLPKTHMFEIEDIQDEQLNHGIRAAVLTQLHNIPTQKINVLFDKTECPERPIKLVLKPRVIGLDCAHTILEYAGCNFALHKNEKLLTLQGTNNEAK